MTTLVAAPDSVETRWDRPTLGVTLGYARHAPPVLALQSARAAHTIDLVPARSEGMQIHHLIGCDQIPGDADTAVTYTLDQAATLTLCGICHHRRVQGPYVDAMRTADAIRGAVEVLRQLDARVEARGYAVPDDASRLTHTAGAISTLALDNEVAVAVADERNLAGVRAALDAMAARIDPRRVLRRDTLAGLLVDVDADPLWRLLCPNVDGTQLEWMLTAKYSAHSPDPVLWAQLCDVLDPVAGRDTPATHVVVSRAAPHMAVSHRDLRTVTVVGWTLWVWTADALDAAAVRHHQYDHICVAAADVGADDIGLLADSLIDTLALVWDPTRGGLADLALWGERSS